MVGANPVARNELNTLRVAYYGYVRVSLLSPYGFPLGRVPCKLLGGGQSWPSRTTTLDGEAFWDFVPLDTYEVEIQLGGRTMKAGVPWLRDGEVVHAQRLWQASQVLGPASSTHGTQVRLIGLGYDCLTVDGDLGSASTRKIIERFQRDRDFDVNGRANPEMQDVLVALLGA